MAVVTAPLAAVAAGADGLMVEVHGEQEAEARKEVVRRRLAFEENPAAFRAQWARREERLAGQLAAARALGNPAPEGDLVWCDGVYWLSLPADAERAACLLSEFTGPADSSPFLSSRLGEHGSTLLTGEALAVLLHYFPEKME